MFKHGLVSPNSLSTKEAIVQAHHVFIRVPHLAWSVIDVWRIHRCKQQVSFKFMQFEGEQCSDSFYEARRRSQRLEEGSNRICVFWIYTTMSSCWTSSSILSLIYSQNQKSITNHPILGTSTVQPLELLTFCWTHICFLFQDIRNGLVFTYKLSIMKYVGDSGHNCPWHPRGYESSKFTRMHIMTLES